MSHGTYIVLLALLAFAAIPESTASPARSYSGAFQIRRNGRISRYYTRLLGNCIKKYGHSCMGGHGKRTQLPILPSYAMSDPSQPGYIFEKFQHSKIASKRRIPTSGHYGYSDQENQSEGRFPQIQITSGEIGNGFTDDNREVSGEFFLGNGLDDFKESITADNGDHRYTSEQLGKNRLFEKFLLNLINIRRQSYDATQDEVDTY